MAIDKQDTWTASPSMVRYETARVEGLNIAYRQAGNPESPKLVLLHLFPASSHQYRNLLPALADRFHVIAPDYPGFGNSDMPDPASFAYTFDRLSYITASLLTQKRFDRYGLFVQDYGGPVGFRIVTRNPDALEWLIIQNTNAYEVGFTAAWAGLRNALWKKRTPESEQGVAGLLEFESIKAIYLHGHQHPELISPDNWNMDFRFMERPNARRVQMDLFYDYRTNVELYPQWQKFLRERQPRTIIFWGHNDIFFTPEGGEAYLRDLPDAQMHHLDSGHFAVEDCLDRIAGDMCRFYDEKVAPVAQRGGPRRARCWLRSFGSRCAARIRKRLPVRQSTVTSVLPVTGRTVMAQRSCFHSSQIRSADTQSLRYNGRHGEDG